MDAKDLKSIGRMPIPHKTWLRFKEMAYERGMFKEMNERQAKTIEFFIVESHQMLRAAQAVAATLGGGECELVYGENDYGDDGWWCQSCGGWFAASFRHTKRDNIIEPRYCQQCGREAVKR